MKTIGLIGGTGWISTAEYYRIINEETNKRLGGLDFAKCILFSLNYGEIDTLNRKKDFSGVFSLILDASERLILSGADCIVLCANTLHRFADELEEKIDVPLIHIAKATAKEIRKYGLTKVGLLGTRQTMELDFYKTKLKDENIETIIPDKEERDFIQSTISNELLMGMFFEKSRMRFQEIMEGLNRQGAQAIVLGCTEIPLLIKQKDITLQLFNTLEIHSIAAVDFALG